MQAMLEHDETRRAGNGRAGQLPVLFHLMDVSRQRPAVAQGPAADEPVQLKAAVAPPPDAQSGHQSLEIPAAGVLGSGSTHVAPPNLTTSPAFPSIAPAVFPEPATIIAPAAEPSVQPSAAPANVLVAPPSVPDATVTAAITETIFPASPPSITNTNVEEPEAAEPIGQPEEPIAAASQTRKNSRRKSKRPASEDWFASHGKFIAIAFVLALLGTIYFARTNRRQPLAENGVANAEPAQRPNEKSFDARPMNRTSGYRVTSSESNSAQAESPSGGGDSKAELHPPQLASGDAAGDKASAADNLFVFPAKKGDERMAVRPETATTGGGSTTQGPTSGNPASSGPSATGTSPPAATQPEVTPVYPTTSQPAPPRANLPTTSVYPVTGAPPVVPSAATPASAAGPINQAPAGATPGYTPPSYRSQYPAPTGASPPSAQAWSPPAPGGGLPSQYQPSDTTARGSRYERTGSGNY